MYEIRKCRSYTISEASKSVNIDPEAFRNISYPYEGESELDFLNYLDNLQYEADIYNIYEELEKDAADQLCALLECEDFSVFHDSSTEDEGAWLESGKVDLEYTKNGKFKTNFTTQNENW